VAMPAGDAERHLATNNSEKSFVRPSGNAAVSAEEGVVC
jgi:hypothetical protein